MISVCIATHNGEHYIKDQITSILTQLNDNDEVIISDDGSTDQTLNVIESIEDPRIKLYRIAFPQGRKPHYYVAKNFENALKHASGDIIFLADQDDVWYPNKVSVCLSALKSNIAVLHNLSCVNEVLEPLNYNWYNEKLKFRPLNILMRRGKHMGCALAFKKELLKLILPFPKNLYIHDFWIGIIAELKGALLYIDQPLVYYRIHSNNTSGESQNKNSFFFKLYYRVCTIFNFLWRLVYNSLVYDVFKIRIS